MVSSAASPKSIHLEQLGPGTSHSLLAHARQLLLEYGQFVIAQPGAARFCYGSLEKEAAGLPSSYIHQGGGFLVATLGTEPVACVAWRELAPTSVVVPNAWEMKRLWVSPSGRGHNLGRILTQAVLDRAAAAHRSAVYLDTAPASMGAAHQLYLAMGFEPSPAYNDNPVEGLAYLVKFITPHFA